MPYSMCASIVILSVVVVISLSVATIALCEFVRLTREPAKSRFFLSRQSVVCGGLGQIGISTLCFDDEDISRLTSLLAVEYPYYEVIVVADSLQRPSSFQKMIDSYHMVAVDYGAYTSMRGGAVRRMYRSTHRCYRRLILLDVATEGCRSDLDIACEVATYDLLMPLWNTERLVSGAIERIVAELSTLPDHTSQVVGIGVEEEWLLIPAKIAREYGGVSEIKYGSVGTYRIRERLICGNLEVNSDGGRRHLAVFVGAMVLCVMVIVAGVAVEAVCVVLVTLLFVMLVAYASSKVVERSDCSNVKYGRILYLFCEKILSQIWQIRK